MTERRYTVLFEPAEEGGFVATCPALPGLVTEGETLEEAREMVKDAIRGYLESLAMDGLPAPRTSSSPKNRSKRRSKSLSREIVEHQSMSQRLPAIKPNKSSAL
jgi:antitoxin HicB